ncbi:ectonucleoside triphosphate diphosphohydrolase 8-like protein [Pitangus sulphuratus]|nr:ectonucleoside triphosphate diphosphohydrolase 8-like protein [Pitangus sulphuratus]
MDSKAKVVAGLLAATCVCSIIALILSVVNVKDVFLPPSTKYGLVFDAGSTHTSLYTYRWPADKENGTGIVSQVDVCTVSGPGISSYADDPAGAGASLRPCLDKAMQIVPAEQQRDTPTYLGATAGMRLLSFLNLTTQTSLNDVNATILAFCKRNWSELERTFPEAKKYLHTYCSVGIYILTLLLDGFKFSELTWSNIHFSRQAANTDIGWTLGFMLNFTNMIPAEPLELVKGHQPGLWAGAVSFIVLALVTGLVAALLLCFWKTK